MLKKYGLEIYTAVDVSKDEELLWHEFSCHHTVSTWLTEAGVSQSLAEKFCSSTDIKTMTELNDLLKTGDTKPHKVIAQAYKSLQEQVNRRLKDLCIFELVESGVEKIRIIDGSLKRGKVVISRSDIERKAAWVGRWCSECAKSFGGVPCAEAPYDMFHTCGPDGQGDFAVPHLPVCERKQCSSQGAATYACKTRCQFGQVSKDIRAKIIESSLDDFKANAEQHSLHLTQFCSSKDRGVAAAWMAKENVHDTVFLRTHEVDFETDAAGLDTMFSICKVEYEHAAPEMTNIIAEAAMDIERADDIAWILDILDTGSRPSNGKNTDDNHAKREKIEMMQTAMSALARQHQIDALNALATELDIGHVIVSGSWVSTYTLQELAVCDGIHICVVSDSGPLYSKIIEQSTSSAQNTCIIYRGTLREVIEGFEGERQPPDIWWLVTGAAALHGSRQALVVDPVVFYPGEVVPLFASFSSLSCANRYESLKTLHS
eukprot:SAG11_NODE_537_length_8672_cov_3.282632_6_plen_488_part_00